MLVQDGDKLGKCMFTNVFKVFLTDLDSTFGRGWDGLDTILGAISGFQPQIGVKLLHFHRFVLPHF